MAADRSMAVTRPVEPLAEERDRDAVAAADLEDAVGGSDGQRLQSPPEAVGVFPGHGRQDMCMDGDELVAEAGARAVVLVEGVSDRLALDTLAVRRGRDLAAEGVSVLAIGGAQAIGRYLRQLGPQGRGVRLAGLCDVGEEAEFRRGLERAGLGSELTRAGMEQLGFYVCEADLEDELIRALGAPEVERVVAAQGELVSFRTLQKQPEWRGRPVEQQLRRFMGSGGRRKIRYARLLVDALELDRVPRPLDRLLAQL
jgi:hypothetical protein